MSKERLLLFAVFFVAALVFGRVAKADQNYLDIWNWSFQVNDGEQIKVKENVGNSEYPRLNELPLRIYGWGSNSGNPLPHALGEYGIYPNKAYVLELRFEAETCPDDVNNAIDLNYWEGIEGNGSPLQRERRNFFMRQHPDSPRKGTSEADPNIYDLLDLTNNFTENAQIWLPNITSSTPRSPNIYDKWQKIISNYADLHPSVFDGNLPDGKVTFADFAVLANHWKKNDCNSANNWCDYADLNRDGNVDYNDVDKFNGQWLVDANSIR